MDIMAMFLHEHISAMGFFNRNSSQPPYYLAEQLVLHPGKALVGNVNGVYKSSGKARMLCLKQMALSLKSSKPSP